MTWYSLTAAMTSRSDLDPERQKELRRRAATHTNVVALSNAEAALLEQINEGRIGDEDWQRKKACGRPTQHLFHLIKPEEDDPRIRNDRELNRIEFDRDRRLAEARGLCNSCPVEAACLAFYMRLGGRDKWAFGGGTTASERKQLVTWVRIEMHGGCPIIDEVGWTARRKLFRAFRSEAKGRPFKIRRPEPQPGEDDRDIGTMITMPSKIAVVSDTPWQVPVAVPHVDAWTTMPAIGKAVHAEASRRRLTLTDRQIEAMLDTFQIVDDLNAVVR